jgi:hypothetical protein
MNRRAGRRFVPGRGGIPLTCRLRPGPEVRVVNLSSTGALVEGPCRLRPGSIVSVVFGATAGGPATTCRVTRCVVAAIGDGCGVSYQAGLCFVEPLPSVDAGWGGE